MIAVAVGTSGAVAEGGRKTFSAETAKPGAAVVLPPAAEDTRLALLDAAESGRLDDLKGVAELNELKPETGARDGEDLVAHWRRISADGGGKDIFAAIKLLLSAPPIARRTGRDAENSTVFVWPDFAGMALDTITSSQSAHLEAIAGAADALRMRAQGRYDGWELSIGADGVWHKFRRGRD